MPQAKHDLHPVMVRVSVRFPNFTGSSVVHPIDLRGVFWIDEKLRIAAIPTLNTGWQMLNGRLKLLARVHLRDLRLTLSGKLLLRRAYCLCKFLSAFRLSYPFLNCRLRSLFHRGFSLYLFDG